MNTKIEYDVEMSETKVYINVTLTQDKQIKIENN